MEEKNNGVSQSVGSGADGTGLNSGDILKVELEQDLQMD